MGREAHASRRAAIPLAVPSSHRPGSARAGRAMAKAMIARCPSCRQTFERDDAAAPRSTAACPRCGRIVVLAEAAAGASPGAAADEPGTAPFLEPLDRGEAPTEIGVAGRTLSLPAG